MSPVQQTSGHATRALLLAVSTVGLVILVLWGASVFITHRHNGRNPSGTVGGQFDAGKAEKLANEIHDHHQPVFFPDVSGNHVVNLYVQHVGSDPRKGWVVFDVQVPRAKTGCVWRWQSDDHRFRASCDRRRTLAADAPTVDHYPVRVVKGRLKIDLTTNPSKSGPSKSGPSKAHQ